MATSSGVSSGCHVLYNRISYVLPRDKLEDGAGLWLLKDVCFSAEPGQMVAIMGPSGSGKTSLLNIIGGRTRRKLKVTSELSPLEKGEDEPVGSRFRKTEPEPSGAVFIDGVRVDSASINGVTRYVMQADILQAYLTVQETLMFGAKLRLADRSRAEQRERVEDIIKKLALEECRDVKVGDHNFKGISGGQKKRLAIGLELLEEPRLLFLDEPTSGLDASLAYDVVKTLRNLASSGMTVIATIHQPRPQIFSMFDRLVLLSQGETVFYGDVRRVKEYLNYIDCPVRQGFTVPDHLLDMLTPSSVRELSMAKSRESFSRESLVEKSSRTSLLDDFQLQSLAVKYKSSPIGIQMTADFEAKLQEILQAPATEQIQTVSLLKRMSRKQVKMFKNIGTLAHREFLNNMRAPIWVVGLSVTVILTLVVGLIYYRVDKPKEAHECLTYFNLLGSVAFSLLNTSYVAVQTSVTFPLKRPQFNRECAGRLYHPLAFFIGSFVADLFKILLYPTTHLLIIYWLVGFGSTAAHFFFQGLLLWLIALAAVSFSTICAMVSPNTVLASALAPTGVTLVVLLSGIYVIQEDLPAFWRAMSYLAWVKYGINGYMLLHYKDLGIIKTCGPFPEKPGPWGNLGLIGALAAGMLVISYFCLIWTNRRLGLET